MAKGNQRYDPTTVVLHWAVALGVAFQWAGGRTIDWFPRGLIRIEARSVHILVGAALVLLVVFRLWWRSARGVRLTSSDGGAAKIARHGMHGALYFLVSLILLLGAYLAWVRGDHIMDWFAIPALGDIPAPARHAYADKVAAWHGLVANLVLVLAALHGGAALFHQFVLRDRLLQRMALNGRNRS